MTRHTPARHKLTAMSRTALIAVLAAALGSCREPEPTQPSDLSPQLGRRGSTGTFEVTVFESDGDPAVGYTVTAVTSFGPYQADGETPALAQTNASGKATLSGLASGSYCVHARPVSLAAALADDFIIPPPMPIAVLFVSDEAGAILGKKNKSVLLDKKNWLNLCGGGAKRPTKLGSGQTKKLEITTFPSSEITIEYLDLDGNTVSVPAWAVIALTPSQMPWFNPGDHPPDVDPAILVGANANVAGVVQLFTPPNEDLIIESGFFDGGTQGQLTATTSATSGSAGSTIPIEQAMATLLCTRNDREERTGDGNGIDFQEPMWDGFRAQTNLTRIPDEVAISWEQTGYGDAELRLRDRGASKHLMAGYECDSAGCRTTTLKGNLAGTVTAEGFFTDLGSGRVRVKWAISNLPSDDVQWFVATSGDQAPDPDRADDEEGYFQIPVPNVCIPDQSNDDRWFVGG